MENFLPTKKEKNGSYALSAEFVVKKSVLERIIEVSFVLFVCKVGYFWNSFWVIKYLEILLKISYLIS